MKHPEGAICLIAFYAAMKPAICLWCSSMRADLGKAMPEGAKRMVSGRVERFREQLQIVHPDHMLPRPNLINYRLSSRFIR